MTQHPTELHQARLAPTLQADLDRCTTISEQVMILDRLATYVEHEMHAQLGWRRRDVTHISLIVSGIQSIFALPKEVMPRNDKGNDMNSFARNVMVAALIVTGTSLAVVSMARANGLKNSYNSQVTIVIPDLSKSSAAFITGKPLNDSARKKHWHFSNVKPGYKPRRMHRKPYFSYRYDATRYSRVPVRPGRIGRPHW